MNRAIVVRSAPMRRGSLLACASLVMATAAAALPAMTAHAAQPAASPSTERSNATPPKTRKNVTASGYTTTDEPFRPRRGLSVEAEVGVFVTFGGRNANDADPNNLFPSRSASNANPYLALIVGYDVVSTESFALNIGPKFGVAFNGGSSRLSEDDVAVVGVNGGSTFANDYAVYEAGLNATLLFGVTERLWLTGRVNGGAIFVDANPNVDFCGRNADSDGPSPVLPEDPTQAEIEAFRAACGDTDAGDLAIGGLFAASVGIEWYTLLDGFSVGLEVRFHGMLVDDFIPGLAIPATLRYTF